MKISTVTLLIIIVCALPLAADYTVTGEVTVAHVGYEDYVFEKSFVFIEETDTHFPINRDGGFEITVKDPGDYTITTICPGFKPARKVFAIPVEEEEEKLVLEISLQVIPMRVEIANKIPRFVINIRDSAESISGEAEALSDNEYHPLVQDSVREKREPGINLRKIIDFIRKRREERKN